MVNVLIAMDPGTTTVLQINDRSTIFSNPLSPSLLTRHNLSFEQCAVFFQTLHFISEYTLFFTSSREKIVCLSLAAIISTVSECVQNMSKPICLQRISSISRPGLLFKQGLLFFQTPWPGSSLLFSHGLHSSTIFYSSSIFYSSLIFYSSSVFYLWQYSR